MKQTLSRWAVVLLMAGVAAAQDDGAPDARAEFDALVQEYQDARAELTARNRAIASSEAYREAVEARDREKMTELMGNARLDTAPFVKQAQDAATRYLGTEAAVPFLNWIVNYSGDREATTAAVGTLVANYVTSEALLPLVENAAWASRGMAPADGLAMLTKIAEESPHDLVCAHALYNASNILRRTSRGDVDAAAEADKMLAAAEELAEGSELLAKIQAPRFAKQRLQIGMEVPDIEGEDLDGVPFKLSDYRGKVVVIDFWGDW